MTGLELGLAWRTYSHFTGRSGRTLMSEDMIKFSERIGYF